MRKNMSYQGKLCRFLMKQEDQFMKRQEMVRLQEMTYKEHESFYTAKFMETLRIVMQKSIFNRTQMEEKEQAESDKGKCVKIKSKVPNCSQKQTGKLRQEEYVTDDVSK
ncbi:hypothetical protein STEG23_024161, partial [Scotinomys teguina]